LCMCRATLTITHQNGNQFGKDDRDEINYLQHSCISSFCSLYLILDADIKTHEIASLKASK
ncbi:MAG: hypothetical protein WAP30_03265, partial [Acetomicrobium sp.]